MTVAPKLQIKEGQTVAVLEWIAYPKAGGLGTDSAATRSRQR